MVVKINIQEYDIIIRSVNQKGVLERDFSPAKNIAKSIRSRKQKLLPVAH